MNNTQYLPAFLAAFFAALSLLLYRLDPKETRAGKWFVTAAILGAVAVLFLTGILHVSIELRVTR